MILRQGVVGARQLFWAPHWPHWPVRCWFAPHDLPIGAKTWDTEIRLRDKLLLIVSENSIASDWVEDEVNKAFAAYLISSSY